MKRFTDTAKWAEAWYQDLPVKYKAFWSYINDACDACGVWPCNMRLATFQIGEPFEASEILRLFKNIKDTGDGKWWIEDFCDFQYGTLSPECRPHQNVIKLLHKHGLQERVLIPYSKGIGTAKEQDKEKEQEKDKERLLPKTEEAIRLAGILGRKPTTPWSDKEIKTFKALQPIDTDDLIALEKYYASEKSNPKNCLRRDVGTLLNNYRGEVDRAMNYSSAKSTATKKQEMAL